MTEDSIRVTAGRPTSGGSHGVGDGPSRRSGGLPIPTEAIVFAVLTAALLIAGALADNFDSPAVWTNITLLGLAYILSRGLVKRGHGDDGL